MIEAIDAVRVRGDSVGGVVTCIARNVPRVCWFLSWLLCLLYCISLVCCFGVAFFTCAHSVCICSSEGVSQEAIVSSENHDTVGFWTGIGFTSVWQARGRACKGCNVSSCNKRVWNWQWFRWYFASYPPSFFCVLFFNSVMELTSVMFCVSDLMSTYQINFVITLFNFGHLW